MKANEKIESFIIKNVSGLFLKAEESLLSSRDLPSICAWFKQKMTDPDTPTVFLWFEYEAQSHHYDGLVLRRVCCFSLQLWRVPREHQVFDVNNTQRPTARVRIFGTSDRNLKSPKKKKKSF